MHSEASMVYMSACNRAHAECALELVNAFNQGDKEVPLSQRAVPLNDVDIACVAEALRGDHALHVLNLEENVFGLQGLQALLEALEDNPGIVRELRLGKNKLKDQSAVVIGHTLTRNGCGLKVLDLSENNITKLGVIPLAQALGMESCEIVELSLHNNKIEADAAVYLAQALRQPNKLKHLHLGYNSLRDTGAMHLARCFPVSMTLSTLDLTANRIGPDGGQELACALMTSTCNLQRLNLRHNLFDSDTIELFGEVLLKNTSLIQLFLGFMNPTPEAAAVVLSALRHNKSLLLLDIYGWKLEMSSTKEVLKDILASNSTVAAIVTDGCESISKEISRANTSRNEKGQHPVYVGPDDRDAYLATRSLRQFSRAQSRRQSRASSRGVSPHGDSAQRSRSRHTSIRRRSPRSSSAQKQLSPQQQQHSPASSKSAQRPPATTENIAQTHTLSAAPARRDVGYVDPQQAAPARRSPVKTARDPQSRGKELAKPSLGNSVTDSLNHTVVVSETDREIAALLHDLSKSGSDPLVRDTIGQLIGLLQYKIDTQRIQYKKDLQSLEDRLSIVESRRECTCNMPMTKYIEPKHMFHSRQRSGASSNADPDQRSVSPSQNQQLQLHQHNHVNEATGSPRSRESSDFIGAKRHAGDAVTGRPQARSGALCLSHEDLGNGSMNSQHAALTPGPRAPSLTGVGMPNPARGVNSSEAAPTSGPDGFPRRQPSRQSERHCPTPLHYPSVHPMERSEPPMEPEEIKEERPADVNLQPSLVSEKTYPPRINPSPMRDADPPRRKVYNSLVPTD